MDAVQKATEWAMTDGCVGFISFGRKLVELMDCRTCGHIDGWICKCRSKGALTNQETPEGFGCRFWIDTDDEK